MSTLILMPGLDGTGELFLPFLRIFKKYGPLQILCYPTNIPQDYDGLSTYAASRLPNEPCFLLAESFSGPIAIRLAHEYPDRIKGLILCNTFSRNPCRWLSAGRRVLGWLPLGLLARNGVSFWLLGACEPVLNASLHKTLLRLPNATLHQRINAILTVNVQSQLNTLPMPILELVGSHDRMVSPIAWPTAMRSSGQVKTCVLNAPHLLMQTVPEEAANLVASFMASCLKDT